MSAGKKFLRAVIEDSDPKALRRCKEDWFNEDETAYYECAIQHLNSYGSLPSVEVMTQEGFPLQSLHGNSGANYYLDVLRRRHAYTSVNERHPQLVQCMKNKDFDGLLDTLRDMTREAASVLDSESYVSLGDEMDGVVDEYNEAKYTHGLKGVPFGWSTLDHATGGMQGGDLIVVAGRPSLGKSWLLLNMARSAHLAGKTVCFTSMEMSLRQIARRWLGLHLRVNPNYIKDGELSTMSETRMLDAVAAIKEDTEVNLLAGDMSKQVSGIENMVLEFNPDVVFVDSAYLLSPSGSKKGYISRWESISEVVRELKALALRVDKPIVISVQFNRNQKNNSNGELDLSDIAGSDSIPQDASIVLGLQKGAAPNQNSQRIVDCMKNREGDTPRFATSFTFSPVVFEEVPLVEGGEADETVEEFDSDWMQ
tara:strand:+ start:6200 stop:7471 length:1272 start_codon:yes stop_codon:yes gene_type:complete